MESQKNVGAIRLALTLCSIGRGANTKDLIKLVVIAKFIIATKDEKVIKTEEIAKWRYNFLSDFCNELAEELTRKKLIDVDQARNLFKRRVKSHEHFPKEQEVLRDLACDASDGLTEILKSVDFGEIVGMSGALLEMENQKRFAFPPEIENVHKVVCLAQDCGIPYDPEKLLFRLDATGAVVTTTTCLQEIHRLDGEIVKHRRVLEKTLDRLHGLDLLVGQVTTRTPPHPTSGPGKPGPYRNDVVKDPFVDDYE